MKMFLVGSVFLLILVLNQVAIKLMNGDLIQISPKFLPNLISGLEDSWDEEVMEKNFDRLIQIHLRWR